MYTWRGQRTTSGVSFHFLPSETGSLGFSLYQAGRPAGFQGSSCLCFYLCQHSTGIIDEMRAIPCQLYVSSRDLNSGPPACVASITHQPIQLFMFSN